MIFDERVIGVNASTATRDEWAQESWPRIQLIWAFMILLHFCALLHIDPLILHALSIVVKLMPVEAATPSVGYCANEALFNVQV